MTPWKRVPTRDRLQLQPFVRHICWYVLQTCRGAERKEVHQTERGILVAIEYFRAYYEGIVRAPAVARNGEVPWGAALRAEDPSLRLG